MTFRVIVTQGAQDDITRNALWWAEHHSLEQALEWSDAIYDQLATLDEMPERHAFAPENASFAYDIREKPLGLGPRPSYRAVFTLRGSEVYVLAVRRGSQDVVRPDDPNMQ